MNLSEILETHIVYYSVIQFILVILITLGINLNVLKQFAIEYPDAVLGLSDHTPGHAAVLGAVSLGASVIEKHFTDNNERIGPDHKFALNPYAWREMVDRLES